MLLWHGGKLPASVMPKSFAMRVMGNVWQSQTNFHTYAGLFPDPVRASVDLVLAAEEPTQLQISVREVYLRLIQFHPTRQIIEECRAESKRQAGADFRFGWIRAINLARERRLPVAFMAFGRAVSDNSRVAYCHSMQLAPFDRVVGEFTRLATTELDLLR